MKKIIKNILMIILIAVTSFLHAQNVITESEIGKEITQSSSPGFRITLKGTEEIEKVKSTSTSYILNLKPFRYRDFIPPAPPGNVQATALGTTSVSVSFNPVIDNIELDGYAIYRDSVRIDYITDTSYTDSGLNPLTTYSYTIRAIDASGNESLLSQAAPVTTLDDSAATTIPEFSSYPQVRSVTNTSAVIEFGANKPINATIEYGLDYFYGKTAVISEYKSSHVVTITDLSPDTTYHYRVVADDFNNNGPIASYDNTWTTNSTPDTTLPQFTGNPNVAYISDTSVTITWVTDEDTLGSIHYGTSSTDEYAQPEGTFEMNHSITLSGLSPETSYIYTVRTSDISGNGPVESAAYSFITLAVPDTTPPTIMTGPAATYLAETTAVIEWQTNEPATGILRYGTESGNYDRIMNTSGTSQAQTLTLINLTGDTTYYATVETSDPQGNQALPTAEFTFTTNALPDNIDPALSYMQAVSSDSTATISWVTSELTDSKVIYGSESGNLINQKYLPALTINHEVPITGLLPETTYYYKLSSNDPSGNMAVSAEQSFTTKASGSIVPLVMSNIVVSETTDKIVITWTTNNVGTSTVYYREKNASSWTEVTDPVMINDHTIRLDKATLGSGTFYLRVRTRDIFDKEDEKNTDDFGTSLEVTIP